MIDSNLALLFGSATRARTLAALAGSSTPLTGYRVAQLTAVQPIKAYAELARLRKAGVVTERLTDRGRKGWELTDPDILSLCRRRARLSSSTDWETDVKERSAAAAAIVSSIRNINLKQYRSNRTAVPNAEEYRRPAAKDRVLARAGLAPSRWKGSSAA